MSTPYNLGADAAKVKPWTWDDKVTSPAWPNNAKIAVSFVINYEESSEHTIINGDMHNETHLWEAPGGRPHAQERVCRLFRLFNKHDMKYTLYGVGMAFEKNPAVAKSSVENGHDIASHAYRWIDYHSMSAEQEKEYIRKGIESIKEVSDGYPKGWYHGRLSPRSHALVDVPAEKDDPNPQGMLMVPYSYDCNDYKFNVPTGFGAPMDFYDHVKGAFDVLYEEGSEGMPEMMTSGLHCRCIGKPARFAALKKFVEYIAAKFPYQKGKLAVPTS
ncbi:glycoside hydrolase/deacetylase [Bimuria novae-zelandiae CBS 107.79]|uniref:Glycoside hydrolase/deacetylase n=1 Tax=Bimuria novae-zelandiae CBS 107.79 TaxID=1447943 RepID=A0A6A5VR03_9PLEO|nr:glycoside hydrolase/deacetylase [Bimuria novae-zelandiae CBS 107.79]